MKKLISLILALVMTLSCFCVEAYADSTTKVTFDKTNVTNGDTVVLSFTMPETNAMKDITALGIKLSYDQNAFAFDSIADGWMADATGGKVIANWAASNAIQGDNISGKTFTVTFKCITGTPGTYGFTVAFDPDNCYNSVWDELSIPSASGTVAVTRAGGTVGTTKVSFDKSSVANGETVVLSFTMPETDAMKDITTLGIKLSYDKNAFEYDSFDSSWMADATGGKVIANWAASNAIQGDNISGKTFTVTFKCITAKAGTYGFKVEFDSENCMNSAWDELSIPSASGTVAVTSSPCNHAWNSGVVTTQPTCTKMGVRTCTCTKCGATKTEDIAAKGHNFIHCKCTVCGALDHNYKAVVTAPTCTAGGYTTYTCENCGDSYKSNYTEALGHSYKTVVTEPTCTAAGYTTYTCATCGYSYKSDYTDALGHSIVHHDAKAATCTEGGWAAYDTCSRCDHTTFSATNALDHNYKTVVTAPTCTAGGYTTYTCKNCGDSYKSDYTEALGHNYKAVVTKPTCTAAGYTTYTCENCGHSYKSDYTDALGHGIVHHDAKAATCTEGGWAAYDTCSRCDYTTFSATNALGHNYKTVVTAPTCTAIGYTTYTCENCGDSYKSNYTEALGHSYKTVVTMPTCTAAGYTTYSCEVCGHSYQSDYRHALGHNYGDWTSISETQHQRVCANDASHVETAAHNFVGNTCADCGYVKAYRVSGSVKSYNSETDVITIQLLKDGEVAYTTTVTGNNTTYTFDAVTTGTYTLRATKSAHVDSQYTITVNAAVTQDITLYLLGDVDGNGKVNMVDVTKIRQYLTNNAKYPLDVPAAADVDNSGKINMVDVTKIRQYLTNKDKYPLGK